MVDKIRVKHDTAQRRSLPLCNARHMPIRVRGVGGVGGGKGQSTFSKSAPAGALLDRRCECADFEKVDCGKHVCVTLGPTILGSDLFLFMSLLCFLFFFGGGVRGNQPFQNRRLLGLY